jgi:hypothetical protein
MCFYELLGLVLLALSVHITKIYLIFLFMQDKKSNYGFNLKFQFSNLNAIMKYGKGRS